MLWTHRCGSDGGVIIVFRIVCGEGKDNNQGFLLVLTHTNSYLLILTRTWGGLFLVNI